MEADAEVAAVAGEVEGELGEVSGVDAEGVVGAVEGSIEELASVADAEGSGVGRVAERAGGAAMEQRLRGCLREGFGRGRGAAGGWGLREGWATGAYGQDGGCGGCGEEAPPGPVWDWFGGGCWEGVWVGVRGSVHRGRFARWKGLG